MRRADGSAQMPYAAARPVVLPVAAMIMGLSMTGVQAKPAQCFTTDDGRYACTFRSLDADGSFEISAPDKPTFALWMVEPGVASGTINLGDRDVNLPGLYRRAGDDPACWDNDATGTRICAW